jgi:hypothetical protein
MSMTALRDEYRATFREYARKLDALQGLMRTESSGGSHVEAALLDVEKARTAYNSARDQLANELVRSSLPAHAAAASAC